MKRKTKPIARPPQFRGLGLSVRAEMYRKTPALCGEAGAVIGDAKFQRMMEVVRAESPASFPAFDGAQIADRAVIQAMTEGYALALNTLLSLATPWPSRMTLEETFAPENNEREEKD